MFLLIWLSFLWTDPPTSTPFYSGSVHEIKPEYVPYDPNQTTGLIGIYRGNVISPYTEPKHVLSQEELWMSEADKAFEEGNYTEAESKYKRVAAKWIKNPEPHVKIVRCQIARAKIPFEFGIAPKSFLLKQAVVQLKKAVAMDSTQVLGHWELGRVYLQLGNADEAKKSLQRALEISRSNAQLHSDMGVALFALGEKDAAVKELARASELRPADVELQTNYGTALLSVGRSQEAVTVFEKAARLAPDDSKVLNDLGTAQLTLRDFSGAISNLEKAVQLDPARATYRSNLGYAWSLRGDLDKAMEHYRKAIALDARLISAWINLGNAHAQRREFSDARAAYKKAQAIDAMDPRVKAVMNELDLLEKESTSSERAP